MTRTDYLPASKLPDVGTTIFTTMSQLAAEAGAINLSQGFPSFNPPNALLQRISYHLQNGANQYAPMTGVPSLCRTIADKANRLYGRTVHVGDEVTICSGATEGLFAAVQSVVRHGDEVIVLDPAYDSYEPSVTLAGGTTRHVPLLIDGADFVIDWQRLADTINQKTRLLIVNFPHNPTGAILSAADLDRLAEMLRGTRCLLLSDEVYEHIVFDGERHMSLLCHDELWQRSLVISSFGKTLHATGWKIGYCIAPAALSAEFRKVHQFVTFAVSTPMQHGIADFLQAHPEHCDELAGFYAAKREFFCARLSDSRLQFEPARSTFFQIVDYGETSSDDDVSVARMWTTKHGVAAIPLSVFCAEPHTGTRLRLCFAKDEDTLAEAGRRLCEL